MTLKLKLTTGQMAKFGVLMKQTDDPRTDEEVMQAAFDHAEAAAEWFGIGEVAAEAGLTLKEWTTLVREFDEHATKEAAR